MGGQNCFQPSLTHTQFIDTSFFALFCFMITSNPFSSLFSTFFFFFFFSSSSVFFFFASSIAQSDGQRAGCLPNIVQIIHELWTMGEGLVQQIHMVAGHHKLFPSSWTISYCIWKDTPSSEHMKKDPHHRIFFGRNRVCERCAVRLNKSNKFSASHFPSNFFLRYFWSFFSFTLLSFWYSSCIK